MFPLRCTTLRGACGLLRPPSYTKAAACFASSSKKKDSTKEHPAWAAVVGIEIHAQISAQSKIFSNAPVEFAAAPNSKVSFWDAALPGTLPTLNGRCVAAGLATALALNATINMRSEFDRKHYFYFDLPAGYQITQQRRPLAEHGHLEVGFGDKQKKVTITRLHLEHDSGKSVHTAPTSTLVDLNRAGAGLMEIVTAPDMNSGEEAALFVGELIAILRTLGTCDGRMEEGSLRVDANVSVSRRDGSARGPRCEIKNISGLRFLSRAIDYEVGRQIALLDAGKPLVSVTLTYDAEKNETRPLRTKESAVDYRFMPEPDLPPLLVTPQQIAALQSAQPELPRAKVLRLVKQHGLTLDDSATLVAEPGAVTFLEQCLAYFSEHPASATPEARVVAAWIVSELFGVLRERNLSVDQSPVDAQRLAALLALVSAGEISNRAAKTIFAAMVDDSRAPAILVDERNLRQVSDPEVIARLCQEVLTEHAQKVKMFHSGKTGLLGFFVAQVVAKTGGRANPVVANELMIKALKLTQEA